MLTPRTVYICTYKRAHVHVFGRTLPFPPGSGFAGAAAPCRLNVFWRLMASPVACPPSPLLCVCLSPRWSCNKLFLTAIYTQRYKWSPVLQRRSLQVRLLQLVYLGLWYTLGSATPFERTPLKGYTCSAELPLKDCAPCPSLLFAKGEGHRRRIAHRRCQELCLRYNVST